jgi:hypothetical protein
LIEEVLAQRDRSLSQAIVLRLSEITNVKRNAKQASRLPAEPFAMLRNSKYSFPEERSNPSAMLVGIETAALRI